MYFCAYVFLRAFYVHMYDMNNLFLNFKIFLSLQYITHMYCSLHILSCIFLISKDKRLLIFHIMDIYVLLYIIV